MRQEDLKFQAAGATEQDHGQKMSHGQKRGGEGKDLKL